MSARRGVLAVAVGVAALALGGCWSSPDPEPSASASPAPLPSVAPAGADLVCGMDARSVGLVTRSQVDRAEGELTVVDGVGAGECRVVAVEGASVPEHLAWVTFFAASSPQGVEARARLDGDPAVEGPDVVYGGVDGFVGGAVEPERRMTLGSTASVFFGDTLVRVTTVRGDVGRDPVQDLLALTLQVAASYGLDDATATP